MKKKTALTIAIVLGLGAFGVWTFSSATAPKRKLQAKADVPQGGGLEQPSVEIDRPVAPAEPVVTRPTPVSTPMAISRPSAPAAVRPAILKVPPVRVYTAASYAVEAPKNEVKESDPEPYAPFGRLVRCQLFNTVDSGDIESPLIGKVTDDLAWNGDVIIPKCSEVHAMAQVGQTRDRIVSEGPITFVFPDGRQLIVKGIALDRGYDPAFKTFAVTEGSAGIVGSVIKTDNAAEVKLFAASFISGIAQGLQVTQGTIFGPVNSSSGAGVGNLPGYLLNPASMGVQAVLNRYAQRIEQAIERDGYFIVVPSGKQFLVYVEQDIDLAKAITHGDSRRSEAKADFLRDRKIDEAVTQSRADRDAERAQESQQNGLQGLPTTGQLDQLNQQLQRSSGQLEARGNALRAQADQLNAQVQAEAAK